MKEADWRAQVRDLARLYGWKVYYHPYSLGADAGFPDLVMVRDRVIFVELKGPKGRLSVEQERWIQALDAAGAEWYVWWPDDLDKVEEVLRRPSRDASVSPLSGGTEARCCKTEEGGQR